MKKCVLFLEMWALVLVVLIVLGFTLDTMALVETGGLEIFRFIFINYLPAIMLVATIPAFFLMRWVTKPEKSTTSSASPQ